MLTLSKNLRSLPVYLVDNIVNGTGNDDPFNAPAFTSGLSCRQYFERNRKCWPFQDLLSLPVYFVDNILNKTEYADPFEAPTLTFGLFCQYSAWNRICRPFRGTLSHFRLKIWQDEPQKKPQMWDLTYSQYTCRILWRQWYRHCIITIIKLTHVKDHVLLKLPMLRINNNKNNHKTKGSDEPINRYVKFIILFTQLARKVWRYQNRSRKSRRTGNIMAKRKGTKGQAMINKTLLIE